MKGIPDLIERSLQQWYAEDQQKPFCQVASMGEDKPHVRTMLLYDRRADGRLVLLSRTDTIKWYDLKQSPSIALCFYHAAYGQIIAEGTAELLNVSDAADLVGFYWAKVDAMAKRIYSNDESIPDTFGLIVVQPNFWEILQTDETDYLSSRRIQFNKEDENWQERTCHVL